MRKVMKFSSRVKKVDDITATVRVVTFTLPEDFAFNAGQFISLILETPDGEIRKPYSIASPPLRNGTLDLCVKRVEGGFSSNFLHQLKGGEEIKIIGPMGRFGVVDAACDKDIVFIATGTGISPFRAIIPTLLREGHQNQVMLLTGVRHEHETLFVDEWRELQQKYNNFTHINTISQPKDANYSGETGRVQNLIEKYVPKDFDGYFYICGLWTMISETEKLLRARGVPQDKILYERYD